jgi:hypothetical protein
MTKYGLFWHIFTANNKVYVYLRDLTITDVGVFRRVFFHLALLELNIE